MATTTTAKPSPKPLISSPKSLEKLRFSLLTGAAVAATLYSLILLGPSLKHVVSFFWPLLLSTAVFLFAVFAVQMVSPKNGCDKTGEDLMNYVGVGSFGESDEWI